MAGLDTPSAATVGGNGNVWAVISAPRFAGVTEARNVTVDTKNDKPIKEIGEGIQGTRSEFLISSIYIFPALCARIRWYTNPPDSGLSLP